MRTLVSFFVSFVVAACGSSGTPNDAGTPDGSDATSSACPAQVPMMGTPCSPDGTTCDFGCVAQVPTSAVCTSGTWHVLMGAAPCPASDAGADAGQCPASCHADGDCNVCPQKPFGGYSCGADGTCHFMG
jgi:hypothetical protein